MASVDRDEPLRTICRSNDFLGDEEPGPNRAALHGDGENGYLGGVELYRPTRCLNGVQCNERADGLEAQGYSEATGRDDHCPPDTIR